jgi:hypothetical protein
MFPGTHFRPPQHYYELGATAIPSSSGGVENYDCGSPYPTGVTKLHWRMDYKTNETWDDDTFPGYASANNYGVDGYLDANPYSLKNEFQGELRCGVTEQATYVANVPYDVAVGNKNILYNTFNGYWYPDHVMNMGEFPQGSTIIIHNHGVIAGAGGQGGGGASHYNASTLNNDAAGGGGGGGAGLHDWDFPIEFQEKSINLQYATWANNAGTGGRVSMATISAAANGTFGNGNVVSDSASAGGAGSALNGIVNDLGDDNHPISSGSAGASVFYSHLSSLRYLIYNHSSGKIYSGGGGGGGGASGPNLEADGGAGGAPGSSGSAGETVTGTTTVSGGAGLTGGVFVHHSVFDVGATQSKYIIMKQDGVIKGIDGDSASDDNFDVGTEH